MKKRGSSRAVDIKILLSDLSSEDFKEIIRSGALKEEVPFDFLAQHYPELLSEWYPDYPRESRKATSPPHTHAMPCKKRRNDH